MKCINCNLDKPDDECYPDGSYPLWSHYCRDCRNATMKIILDQHHDQMMLMTHEEKKAFFTSDRKTHYPDWIVIDQPGFREKGKTEVTKMI